MDFKVFITSKEFEEHRDMINAAIDQVQRNEFREIYYPIQNVLDAGSGRTSLYTLTQRFAFNHKDDGTAYKGAKIDCIVYPHDARKKDSIESVGYPVTYGMDVQNDETRTRVNLIEADICKYTKWPTGRTLNKNGDPIKDANGEYVRYNIEYDLVLAHLILGEAMMWGKNTLGTMVENIFTIPAKFFVFIDYKEDPSVDFDFIRDYYKQICKEKNLQEYMWDLEKPKEKPQDFKSFVGRTFKSFSCAIIKKKL